jgi:hypothetical protein
MSEEIRETVEVFAIVEGALSDTIEDLDPTEAYDCADRLAEELAREAGEGAFTDWQVFTLPHYCGGSGDCECVQWLTDHHPYRSSEDN